MIRTLPVIPPNFSAIELPPVMNSCKTIVQKPLNHNVIKL
jgi:hypothetical protein